MQKKLTGSDFIIVVCTETYARRFSGNETSGRGKGAAWEGQLIQQDLYDKGENRRIIPVVFDHANVKHIPLALRGATYYDLSAEDGYDRFYRVLTNQPRIQRPPIGPVRKQLPDLESDESLVLELLNLCPGPLPVEVVARVVHQEVGWVAKTLSRLVDLDIVVIAEEPAELSVRSADGMPEASEHVVGAALQALLDFIENHRRAAKPQMMNVVTLAKAADIGTAAAQVSRAFGAIQSALKSSGNKRLVLEVARLSIKASKAPGRLRAQVEDEALAAICGVSWVYQRTGRLREALARS